MMKRLRYLALAALVAFAACDEEGPTTGVESTGTVTGSVTADGAGVSGVTVTLAGGASQSATSGANGAFTFSNVPVGNYVVTISGVPGDFVCSTTAQPVTVTAGQTSTAAFTCNVVRTASISGAVTSGANPISGASIEVDGPDGFSETKVTGSNGQFQFTGLRSGDYTVTLTPPEGAVCPVTTANVGLVAGEAEIVNFSCEGGGTAPEVTIESITVGGAGTTVPADPDSIAARVEVTVNIDRNGSDLETFQLLARAADGTVIEICRQTFTQGVSGAEAPAAQDDLEITCSWNTDRTRDRLGATTIQSAAAVEGPFAPIAADAARPFHPIFLNGDYELIARVTAAGVDPVSAIVDVTLRNMDAVIMGVTADNTDWNDPTTGAAFPNTLIDPATGLRWLSGDIEVKVYPVIFSQAYDPNNPLLARGAFMFDGFRAPVPATVGGTSADVTVGGTFVCQPNDTGCPQTEAATDGTFTFTFCEAATATDGGACYANITAFNTGDIGARNATLVTVTRFGQFGPTLANLKSVQLFDQDLASGTRGLVNDVLRIDNEGPDDGAMSLTALAHPANALVGAGIFSRTAFIPQAAGPYPGSHFGWVQHESPLNGLVIDPAACGAVPCQDRPYVYPAFDQNANPVTTWCDLAGDLCRAAGTPLAGIGLPTGANKPELVHIAGPGYADPTDAGFDPTPSVAEIIAGADVIELTVTGEDLPGETGAGLDDLEDPNSDTELDYGMTAIHWDRFGNQRNAANFILLGVDGQAPIYSNAAGIAALNPTDPTDIGTVWDPFDDDQHVTSETFLTFGQVLDGAMTPNMLTESAKARGTVSGWTTDRGQGFSGVAGVVMQDHEYRCAVNVFSCAGTIISPDPRYGYTLAAGAAGGTLVLPFVFSEPEAGTDTFLPVGFDAYVAANMAEAAMDGYRDQMVRSYDRAGNLRSFDEIEEGNADHTQPQVGNVQMPTPPTFDFTTAYTWGGETRDAVDLKKTDFDFDFNSILSLQVYVDPAGDLPNASPGRPNPDVDGKPFLETSLQLPLENVAHTAFGSQDILTHTNLSVQQAYLGCLVRADEMGISNDTNGDGISDNPPPAGQSTSSLGLPDQDFEAEPHVHRPRGPRWRTWDHSFQYGLVNTQWNTFTTTSVPGCRTIPQMLAGIIPQPGVGGFGGLGADGIAGTPDDDVAWSFEIRSGRPVITFKGQTSTFVPNVDVSAIALYYLDTAGRAILHDPGSQNWTLIVSDLGAGAYGRSYEYSYTGPLPDDLIDVALPAGNGTTEGWFFVLNLSGANAGHGFIWDRSSNP